MVKKILTYILFLVVVDMIISIPVNILLGNGRIILGILITRLLCISILLLVSISAAFIFFKNYSIKFMIFIASVLTYIAIPIILYILMDNNSKKLYEIYKNAHINIDFFSIIYFPYILAAIICFFLIDRVKLF